jgi:hypothetical protein
MNSQRIKTAVLFVCLFAYTEHTHAYVTISGGDAEDHCANGCATCHEEFTAQTTWHDSHIKNADNDCARCHAADSYKPVATAVCKKCHSAPALPCGWVKTHEQREAGVCITCHTACEGSGGISTTTTTIQQSASCAASHVLGANSNESNLLRTFRDTVLLRRETGRLLVRLYYRHSLELLKIVLGDTQLRDQVTDTLFEILPAIENTTRSGEPLRIDHRTEQRIQTVSQSISLKAGPGLRKIIRVLQVKLHNGTLLQEIGAD